MIWYNKKLEFPEKKYKTLIASSSNASVKDLRVRTSCLHNFHNKIYTACISNEVCFIDVINSPRAHLLNVVFLRARRKKKLKETLNLAKKVDKCLESLALQLATDLFPLCLSFSPRLLEEEDCRRTT